MKIAFLHFVIAGAMIASTSAQPPNSRPPLPVESGLRGMFGPDFSARSRDDRKRPKPIPSTSIEAAIIRWNHIAIDASGLDHTPVAAGEDRIYGEQLGPCRASRAIAIIHLAMFEAVNSIQRRYPSYLGLPSAPGGASDRAALAQAARDTLVALFPSQAARFDTFLAEDLARIPAHRSQQNGRDVGHAAAAAILAQRSSDGSAHAEPVMGVDYLPSAEPCRWRQDPIARGAIALGGHWGSVQPFLIESGAQFRLAPPPPLGSLEHASAFLQAKRLGGDGINTPTERTEEETTIGIFWAYDGTPSLCAPPRLYNQLAGTIALQERTSGLELLRLFTLINVAMADTGIAAWESKYHYHVGRPVTAIREAAEDGNVDTVPDPSFHPLGAPASNLSGPNFTPPFPAFPSGHAAFGGALFQTLRRFYGRDDISFTFVSDEFNGVTVDNQGEVRPLVARRFTSLSAAELENAESRIYLGIHWAYDATRGIEQGRKVGDWVYERLYAPKDGRDAGKSGR